MLAKSVTILLVVLLVVLASDPSFGEDVVYVVNSYVHPPNPAWSTVMMLRNDTFAILKTLTLPTGDDAHTIAVTPDGTRLWVTCPPSNGVCVIDAQTFEIESWIDLGATTSSEPMGVAFTPDGLLGYVTCHSGDVVVFDASTTAYVTTISVGGAPDFIVFTPSGTKAYVVDYSGASVVAIRTSDNHVVATRVFEGHALQDAVVSPDGNRVYVSNMDENQIEVIRTSDDTVLAPILTEYIKPRGIGISPDGNYLFVGHYMAVDALVTMLRLSDYTVVSTAPIPSNPRRIAVRPGGRRIIVTEHNENECYAYTVSGESLALTFRTDLDTIAGFNASPVGIGLGVYPSPRPDIKINGVDGPLTLTQADSATLSVHLESDGRSEDADWFIAGSTPGGGIYFWTPGSGWSPAWVPAYSGVLFDLETLSFPSLPLAAAAPGQYAFVFGVDVRRDGLFSPNYLYWDIVWLRVTE